MGALRPGDVIVVRTPGGVASGAWWIRRRAVMKRYPWQPWKWPSDPPGLYNHVAMYTHDDETGRPRGLEGRPSGFGWCNLAKYADDPDAVANIGQPRTSEDRLWLVQQARDMIGIAYDWAAVLGFACDAAGFGFTAAEWPDDGLPSQVVCSSAIDALYEGRGLASPGGTAVTRATSPQEWFSFIAGQQWKG